MPDDTLPAALPPLHGGWTDRVYEVDGRVLWLHVPADPDALLDDPAVLERHERDDYMPYWAHLWPAAVRMADAVGRFEWIGGGRVLELGCGLGLVGIAAAVAGASRGVHVTMSDYDADAVRVALLNAERNGVENVSGLELDWRDPPDLRFDEIVGCDLLYEERDHLPILDAIDRLLEPGGCCWLADPGRTRALEFWHRAEERGYSLAAFCPETGEAVVPRLGSAFVMRLRHPGHA